MIRFLYLTIQVLEGMLICFIGLIIVTLELFLKHYVGLFYVDMSPI